MQSTTKDTLPIFCTGEFLIQSGNLIAEDDDDNLRCIPDELTEGIEDEDLLRVLRLLESQLSVDDTIQKTNYNYRQAGHCGRNCNKDNMSAAAQELKTNIGTGNTVADNNNSINPRAVEDVFKTISAALLDVNNNNSSVSGIDFFIESDPIEGHFNFSQMIPNSTATQRPVEHFGQNGYQTDSQYTDDMCKTTTTTVEPQSNKYLDIQTLINQNTNQGRAEKCLNTTSTYALSTSAPPPRTDNIYGSTPACNNSLSTEPNLLNLDSKHLVNNRHQKSKSLCESEIRAWWNDPTSNNSQQSMIQFEDPLPHYSEPQIDATQQIKRRNSDQMTTIKSETNTAGFDPCKYSIPCSNYPTSSISYFQTSMYSTSAKLKDTQMISDDGNTMYNTKSNLYSGGKLTEQPFVLNCAPPQCDAYHSQTSYSSYNIPLHIIDSQADYSNFDLNGMNQHQTYQSTSQTSFLTPNTPATEYKEEIEWSDDGDTYQKDEGLLKCTDSNAMKGARSTQSVSSTSDWSIYSPFSPAHHGKMQTGQSFRHKKLKRGCRLWEFIRNLLLDPSYNPSHIRWEDRNVGTFRLMQTKSIARIWGMKKGNDAMNYEKLSRAMRYYYKRQVFQPVLGKRLVYRFGPRATGWKED